MDKTLEERIVEVFELDKNAFKEINKYSLLSSFIKHDEQCCVELLLEWVGRLEKNIQPRLSTEYGDE